MGMSTYHQARRPHSPLHARKEAEEALSLLPDSQDLFCQPRNGNEVESVGVIRGIRGNERDERRRERERENRERRGQRKETGKKSLMRQMNSPPHFDHLLRKSLFSSENMFIQLTLPS